MKFNPWMILFFVALFVIFLFQVCKPKLTDTAGRARYDALEQKVKDTVKHYEALLRADSIEKNNAQQATADSREQAEVYRKEVAAQQGTIDRLVFQIRAAKTEKPNGSFVSVSPKYVEGCDSLAGQNTALRTANQQYEDQNAETVKLMLYEISLRDSMYNAQVDFNKKFRSQLDNCMMQLKDGNKAALPRNQVYGEIGLIGNKMHPIAGGSAGLTLINKKGQMYGVKGQHVSSELYIEAKTGFKISFRK